MYIYSPDSAEPTWFKKASSGKKYMAPFTLTLTNQGKLIIKDKNNQVVMD